MPVVSLATEGISDWETFHDVFARTFGFPAYHGRNMNAWIDCFTHVDDSDTQMVGDWAIAPPGDVLTIHIEGVADFAARCPEQYDAVIDCAAFVNWRRIDLGERPILAFSFYK